MMSLLTTGVITVRKQSSKQSQHLLPDASRYGKMPLRKLISLIVNKTDRQALRELHENRPVFQYGGENSLLLVQFLDRLRKAAIGRGEGEIARDAYYLTIDKFSRLPYADMGMSKKIHAYPEVRGSGVNCRYYFSAFLKAASEQVNKDGGGLCEEFMTAKLLQGLVARHYHLSLLESQRRPPPSMSRYVWKLPNGNISLFMPKKIVGKKRRDWLEANVSDPDASRAGERQRIQSIIYKKLGGHVRCSFDDRKLYDKEGSSWSHDYSVWRDSAPISVRGLANAVALEKAASIDEQRPAIQAIGASNLREMIHRIFNDLSDGEYNLGHIARNYGITKATFSRFAGSNWAQVSDKVSEKAIPDLWKNAAKVVSTCSEFVTAAKESGVWKHLVKKFEQRGVLLKERSADE